MTTSKFTAVAGLGAAALGLASAGAAGAAEPGAPVGLEAASRAFDDAQFRKDPAALARMMDPRMVYIRGSGALAGRAEFLAGFSDPALAFDPFVIKDRRVVPLGGEVWAVTGEGVISGTEAGNRFTDHFRYSDVFSRQDGAWRVVYVQVTRLPPL